MEADNVTRNSGSRLHGCVQTSARVGPAHGSLDRLGSCRFRTLTEGCRTLRELVEAHGAGSLGAGRRGAEMQDPFSRLAGVEVRKPSVTLRRKRYRGRSGAAWRSPRSPPLILDDPRDGLADVIHVLVGHAGIERQADRALVVRHRHGEVLGGVAERLAIVGVERDRDEVDAGAICSRQLTITPLSSSGSPADRTQEVNSCLRRPFLGQLDLRRLRRAVQYRATGRLVARRTHRADECVRPMLALDVVFLSETRSSYLVVPLPPSSSASPLACMAMEDSGHSAPSVIGGGTSRLSA